MSYQTFSDSGPGPYRMKMLMPGALYRAMYSKSDWNKIQRGAFIAGGQEFANKYLPLRFDNYARAFLGYPGRKKKGLPLVVTGRLREYILNNYRISATATANKSTMIIDLPTPEMFTYINGRRMGAARTYKANPVVAAVLSRVTDRETEVIQNVAINTMAEMIAGSQRRIIQRGTAAGQERRALSGEQRALVPSNARQHLRSQHHSRKAVA